MGLGRCRLRLGHDDGAEDHVVHHVVDGRCTVPRLLARAGEVEPPELAAGKADVVVFAFEGWLHRDQPQPRPPVSSVGGPETVALAQQVLENVIHHALRRSGRSWHSLVEPSPTTHGLVHVPANAHARPGAVTVLILLAKDRQDEGVDGAHHAGSLLLVPLLLLYLAAQLFDKLGPLLALVARRLDILVVQLLL